MTKARDIASAIPAPSTVSSTELGYLDGVTSAIQTQIDGKQAVNANVSTTELGYLDGVTSSVQTQIDSKIGSASAINPTIVDAKGDIIAATAADTVSTLAVGANGTVLTAASGQATGLEWATPASSGGMTLLSTTTLSGTSTTVSSIDQTYTDLMIVVSGAVFTSGANDIKIQPNGSGTTSWLSMTQDDQGTLSVAHADYPTNGTNPPKHTGGENVFYCLVKNYASTSYVKPIQFTTGYITASSIGSTNGGGYLRTTSAVTSVDVTVSPRTFTAGQILIYGVK